MSWEDSTQAGPQRGETPDGGNRKKALIIGAIVVAVVVIAAVVFFAVRGSGNSGSSKSASAAASTSVAQASGDMGSASASGSYSGVMRSMTDEEKSAGVPSLKQEHVDIPPAENGGTGYCGRIQDFKKFTDANSQAGTVQTAQELNARWTEMANAAQKISDEAPDQGAKDAWKKYADATNAVNNAIGPVSNPDDVAKKLNDQGFATAFNNFNNSWNDLVKNYKDAIAGSCSVTLVGQATA
ncbi:hypothetical protein [Propionibacterium freudenreichii]|uniref:hypothetical protein n=1 Tax=Propionibacterium freudenreichii TaxID=1744 RepID=UPI0021A4E6D7|nr:hypothetical protein [Propionibacterium freudenreichii]